MRIFSEDTLFRHLKSGKFYRMKEISLQEDDLSLWVVYEPADGSGPTFHRRIRDFFDGRFELVLPAKKSAYDANKALEVNWDALNEKASEEVIAALADKANIDWDTMKVRAEHMREAQKRGEYVSWDHIGMVMVTGDTVQIKSGIFSFRDGVTVPFPGCGQRFTIQGIDEGANVTVKVHGSDYILEGNQMIWVPPK